MSDMWKNPRLWGILGPTVVSRWIRRFPCGIDRPILPQGQLLLDTAWLQGESTTQAFDCLTPQEHCVHPNPYPPRQKEVHLVALCFSFRKLKTSSQEKEKEAKGRLSWICCHDVWLLCPSVSLCTFLLPPGWCVPLSVDWSFPATTGPAPLPRWYPN